MATHRYSGGARLRLTYKDGPGNGKYHVTITTNTDRVRLAVNAPAYLTVAVDSPEAFDNAARAAVAFATDGPTMRADGREPLSDHAFDWDTAGSVLVSRKRSDYRGLS